MRIDGFRQIDGVHLRIREQGEGYPVMLTPGGPGCCDYLGPVANLIGDNYRTIRWEPRGCGESQAGGPYDVATTLADMDVIRQQSGHDTWVVGGHSAGAFYALAYALAYPQHTRAVLYLSGVGVLRDRTWDEEYRHLRDTVGEQEPQFAFPHNMDVNLQANASSAAWGRNPHLLASLATLHTPFLAIQGGKDIRPSWPVEQLVNLLPNASLVMLPDAGHNLWLTHGDTLGTMINAFLDGLGNLGSST